MSITRQFIAKTGITLAVAMGTSSCALTQEGQQQPRDPAAPQQLQIPANTDKPTKHTPTKEDEILKILRELRAKQNTIEAELKKNQTQPLAPAQPQTTNDAKKASKEDEIEQLLRDVLKKQDSLEETIMKYLEDSPVPSEDILNELRDIRMQQNSVEDTLQKQPDTVAKAIKDSEDWWDKVLKNIGTIADLITLAALAFTWKQLRDADEQGQLLQGLITNTETNAHEARYFAQLGNTMTRANRTVRDIESGAAGTERIGDFPEMLSYLTERLQSVKKQAILVIPFTQFGTLGTPRFQYEFRQTLYDKFGSDSPDGGPEMVIVTYNKARSLELAARRYTRAPDALNLLLNRPLMEEFISRAIDEDALGDFRTALEKFNKDKNPKDIKRIFELAKQQLTYILGTETKNKYAEAAKLIGAEKEKEEDRIFASRLSRKDKKLFQEICTIRTALSAVMMRQEEKNKFPSKGTVIESPAQFDNKLMLFIDGEEVITCESHMGDITSRSNFIDSTLGYNNLQNHKAQLSIYLRGADQAGKHEKIIQNLEKHMYAARQNPSVKNLSTKVDQLIADNLPKQMEAVLRRPLYGQSMPINWPHTQTEFDLKP